MLDHNIHPHFLIDSFITFIFKCIFLFQGDPGSKGISGEPGQNALKVKRGVLSFDIEQVKKGLVI